MSLPYMSDEARKLDRKHIAVMDERQRLTENLDTEEFQLRLEMDAANLAIRPDYPTPEQVAGIAKVAALLRSNDASGSDHSGPVASDGSVRFHARNSTISIETRAPSARVGDRVLWKFTRAELAAFDELFKAHNIRVLDERNHADGFSVIVTAQKT